MVFFVVCGTGKAIVNGDAIEIRAGTLLLIERGDKHEIRNPGKSSLKTLNFYFPPASTTAGDEMPVGRG